MIYKNVIETKLLFILVISINYNFRYHYGICFWITTFY